MTRCRSLLHCLRCLFDFAFLLLLLCPLLLSACNGGGGGGTSSAEDDPLNFLPDSRFFMPLHATRAKVLIENSELRMLFTCLREGAGECLFGALETSAQRTLVLFNSTEDKREYEVSGRWEQWDANGYNQLNSISIYRADGRQPAELLYKLCVAIRAREDVSSPEGDMILLRGTATSGQVQPDGELSIPLDGAKVTIEYTLEENTL